MKFPELSHLQFAVIDCLGGGKLSGRNLREALVERDIKKAGPAFYQMMSRLEEAKFVKGEYTQKIVEGQIIKERLYSVTGVGAQAYNASLEFYRNADGSLEMGVPA